MNLSYPNSIYAGLLPQQKSTGLLGLAAGSLQAFKQKTNHSQVNIPAQQFWPEKNEHLPQLSREAIVYQEKNQQQASQSQEDTPAEDQFSEQMVVDEFPGEQSSQKNESLESSDFTFDELRETIDQMILTNVAVLKDIVAKPYQQILSFEDQLEQYSLKGLRGEALLQEMQTNIVIGGYNPGENITLQKVLAHKQLSQQLQEHQENKQLLEERWSDLAATSLQNQKAAAEKRAADYQQRRVQTKVQLTNYSVEYLLNKMFSGAYEALASLTLEQLEEHETKDRQTRNQQQNELQKVETLLGQLHNQKLVTSISGKMSEVIDNLTKETALNQIKMELQTNQMLAEVQTTHLDIDHPAFVYGMTRGDFVRNGQMLESIVGAQQLTQRILSDLLILKPQVFFEHLVFTFDAVTAEKEMPKKYQLLESLLIAIDWVDQANPSREWLAWVQNQMQVRLQLISSLDIYTNAFVNTIERRNIMGMTNKIYFKILSIQTVEEELWQEKSPECSSQEIIRLHNAAANQFDIFFEEQFAQLSSIQLKQQPSQTLQLLRGADWISRLGTDKQQLIAGDVEYVLGDIRKTLKESTGSPVSLNKLQIICGLVRDTIIFRQAVDGLSANPAGVAACLQTLQQNAGLVSLVFLQSLNDPHNKFFNTFLLPNKFQMQPLLKLSGKNARAIVAAKTVGLIYELQLVLLEQLTHRYSSDEELSSNSFTLLAEKTSAAESVFNMILSRQQYLVLEQNEPSFSKIICQLQFVMQTLFVDPKVGYAFDQVIQAGTGNINCLSNVKFNINFSLFMQKIDLGLDTTQLQELYAIQCRQDMLQLISRGGLCFRSNCNQFVLSEVPINNLPLIVADRRIDALLAGGMHILAEFLFVQQDIISLFMKTRLPRGRNKQRVSKFDFSDYVDHILADPKTTLSDVHSKMQQLHSQHLGYELVSNPSIDIQNSLFKIQVFGEIKRQVLSSKLTTLILTLSQMRKTLATSIVLFGKQKDKIQSLTNEVIVHNLRSADLIASLQTHTADLNPANKAKKLLGNITLSKEQLDSSLRRLEKQMAPLRLTGLEELQLFQETVLENYENTIKQDFEQLKRDEQFCRQTIEKIRELIVANQSQPQQTASFYQIPFIAGDVLEQLAQFLEEANTPIATLARNLIVEKHPSEQTAALINNLEHVGTISGKDVKQSLFKNIRVVNDFESQIDLFIENNSTYFIGRNLETTLQKLQQGKTVDLARELLKAADDPWMFANSGRINSWLLISAKEAHAKEVLKKKLAARISDLSFSVVQGQFQIGSKNLIESLEKPEIEEILSDLYFAGEKNVSAELVLASKSPLSNMIAARFSTQLRAKKRSVLCDAAIKVLLNAVVVVCGAYLSCVFFDVPVSKILRRVGKYADSFFDNLHLAGRQKYLEAVIAVHDFTEEQANSELVRDLDAKQIAVRQLLVNAFDSQQTVIDPFAYLGMASMNTNPAAQAAVALDNLKDSKYKSQAEKLVEKIYHSSQMLQPEFNKNFGKYYLQHHSDMDMFLAICKSYMLTNQHYAMLATDARMRQLGNLHLHTINNIIQQTSAGVEKDFFEAIVKPQAERIIDGLQSGNVHSLVSDLFKRRELNTYQRQLVSDYDEYLQTKSFGYDGFRHSLKDKKGSELYGSTFYQQLTATQFKNQHSPLSKQEAAKLDSRIFPQPENTYSDGLKAAIVTLTPADRAIQVDKIMKQLNVGQLGKETVDFMSQLITFAEPLEAEAERYRQMSRGSVQANYQELKTGIGLEAYSGVVWDHIKASADDLYTHFFGGPRVYTDGQLVTSMRFQNDGYYFEHDQKDILEASYYLNQVNVQRNNLNDAFNELQEYNQALNRVDEQILQWKTYSDNTSMFDTVLKVFAGTVVLLRAATFCRKKKNYQKKIVEAVLDAKNPLQERILENTQNDRVFRQTLLADPFKEPLLEIAESVYTSDMRQMQEEVDTYENIVQFLLYNGVKFVGMQMTGFIIDLVNNSLNRTNEESERAKQYWLKNKNRFQHYTRLEPDSLMTATSRMAQNLLVDIGGNQKTIEATFRNSEAVRQIAAGTYKLSQKPGLEVARAVIALLPEAAPQLESQQAVSTALERINTNIIIEQASKFGSEMVRQLLDVRELVYEEEPDGVQLILEDPQQFVGFVPEKILAPDPAEPPLYQHLADQQLEIPRQEIAEKLPSPAEPQLILPNPAEPGAAPAEPNPILPNPAEPDPNLPNPAELQPDFPAEWFEPELVPPAEPRGVKLAEPILLPAEDVEMFEEQGQFFEPDLKDMLNIEQILEANIPADQQLAWLANYFDNPAQALVQPRNPVRARDFQRLQPVIPEIQLPQRIEYVPPVQEAVQNHLEQIEQRQRQEAAIQAEALNQRRSAEFLHAQKRLQELIKEKAEQTVREAQGQENLLAALVRRLVDQQQIIAAQESLERGRAQTIAYRSFKFEKLLDKPRRRRVKQEKKKEKQEKWKQKRLVDLVKRVTNPIWLR